MSDSREWRKSSRSGMTSGDSDCVELARLPDGIGVRDSKTRDAGHLVLSRNAFASVVARAKKC